LHGHDDPMAPPNQVADFQEEMTKAGADWQMHIYGNTMHAFTNPNAHDKAFGTVYNDLASKRAWVSMQHFFTEVFL
jgi:dienelactone hydrolase